MCPNNKVLPQFTLMSQIVINDIEMRRNISKTTIHLSSIIITIHWNANASYITVFDNAEVTLPSIVIPLIVLVN